MSRSNLFKMYWDAAAAKCRLTMVGKFFKRKPKMTAIRASFSAKYPLKDHVKIVSFDSLHVFLDFTNEEDYDAIFFKETIIVAGAQMEVFRWTPEFHGPFTKMKPDNHTAKVEGRDETLGIMELDKNEHIGGGNEYGSKESEAAPKNTHILEDGLYISDSVDCVPEATHSDSAERVASPVNCSTATSEIQASAETSCSGSSGLSFASDGIAGGIPSVMDDSSSMCSTDSMSFRGTYSNHNIQKLYGRGWKYGSKSTSNAADWASEKLNQPLDALPIGEHHEDRKSRPPIQVQYSTYRGRQAVTFPENYWESLVPDCKLTLIGNFFQRKPRMKEIRADFIAKNPLKGQVKITHYTSQQVSLDFTNEADYDTVLSKKTLTVAVMQISWWSRDIHHEVGKQEWKAMDKERDVKPGIMEQQKTELDELIGGETEYKIDAPEAVLETPDILGEVSDVSNSLHIVPEVAHPDFRDNDASPVNCDTDTSKMHPSIGITCCQLSGISAPQNMIDGTSPYVMNVNSSKCSTYSILSIVTTGLSSNDKDQSKSIRDVADSASKAHSQPLDDLPEARQQMLKKDVAVSHQSELTESDRERHSSEIPSVSSPPRSPPRSIGSVIQLMSKLKVSVTNDPNSVKRSTSDNSNLTQKSVPLFNSAENAVLLSVDPHKSIEPKAIEKPLVRSISITTENFPSNQVTASATAEMPMPLLPTLPLLAHSVSPAAQLCADPPTAIDTYVPQSYPNGIVGSHIFGRSEQAGSGSIFPSPSQALHQHSLAQRHSQLNSYKVDKNAHLDQESNMIAGPTQLQSLLTTSVSDTTSSIRYMECLKNHAASMGGHAIDGCGEFMPSGGEGTPGALKCEACNCHRNFHRKKIINHRQMAGIGSHIEPRNNSNSRNIHKQSPISQQYQHNYSYSPSSVVNSSDSYPQLPLPISGQICLPQGLERKEPSLIRPSYSYEMVNHDTVQQWEYFWRDRSRNTSIDHPSLRNENQNFDMFKPLNYRTSDNIPSEFANEFPHLDIINNLRYDEHGKGRTLMPNSGFQNLSNGSYHLNGHFT
ncbi:uncharacterized protein LOC107801256 isoform X1 [Nicotiana tabacum]|uniref:Uncharacterized protein LOC107801256 isoform X1 n=1 Tax=Nicotiana tabacum TaxID=4097 RepID=A0A1S4ATY6_TOBAC|nr:PREDICTED: uncharacterized protein LOC107801256 isoform X1 [Nicotiana tabacum]